MTAVSPSSRAPTAAPAEPFLQAADCGTCGPFPLTARSWGDVLTDPGLLIRPEEFATRDRCGQWLPGEWAIASFGDFGVGLIFLAVALAAFYWQSGTERNLFEAPRDSLYWIGVFLLCSLAHIADGLAFFAPYYHLRTLCIALINVAAALSLTGVIGSLRRQAGRPTRAQTRDILTVLSGRKRRNPPDDAITDAID
ncbi:MAG: hypothetical protein AAF907_17740, partial [Planctomycetota bacterium]